MTASPHFDTILASDPGPIVVEVPHAGLLIDEAASRFTRVPAAAVAAGALLADSDVGADAMWRSTETLGLTRIVARASRYVIDLNTEPRLPTPYEEKMPAALRAVLRRSHCGQTWREDPLPAREIERRIREVFEPYHAEIDVQIDRARARHGAALLLSSHTFPDPQARTADVVLGTHHGASASVRLRGMLADVVRAEGLTVALEAPFPGGFSVARHARPRDGVSVVQIEVARRLLCTGSDNDGAVDAGAVERIGRMLAAVAASANRYFDQAR